MFQSWECPEHDRFSCIGPFELGAPVRGAVLMPPNRDKGLKSPNPQPDQARLHQALPVRTVWLAWNPARAS